MRYQRFDHNWKVYDRIPMKNKSILPDEGFDYRPVVLTDMGTEFQLKCLPRRAPNQRWGHRLIALCVCKREIPFGRMSQHRKACEPLQRFTCYEE